MTDTAYYDLLDEVSCADTCEAVIALCELVDKLIADIQFLELECISTRHLLSQYIDKEEGELLRMVRSSCTAAEIQWNSAIILSRCRKPARGTGLVGIDKRHPSLTLLRKLW